MKKLTDIINYNTSSALGWTLIHSIWQGFAILLVFGILYYIFKPSVTRYRLGIGALTLQFLAAIATFFTIYQPVSTSTTSPSNQAFGNFFLNNPNLIFTQKKLTLLQQIEFFLQNNLDVFVMIWLVGTTLLLLRLVVGFTHVQSLKVQQVNPISADIQALMNSLLEKTQMPATIKLLESARASVPMTIGWIKPVVLLPVGMASGLTIKQLEAILAHELAHIKRYDYLVNIFQNFIEIVFFFHPATWFISGKVRDERENCCDDFAVEICGDSLVLAKALTQVASYQQQPRLAMAFGAKRQTFMDRIKRIIGINDTKPMSYGNWAAVLGMILVVALGITYAQNEIKKDSPTAKDEKSTVSKVDAINNVAPVSVADNVAMPADTSKLDEVEAEMEVLSKEMEKYSMEMEVLSRQMEDKARPMDKLYAEMAQYSNKMRVPQRKIQDLSIQMQEVSLAMQKIHNKYMDEDRIPAEVEKKLKALEKQERVLEKQMKEVEQEMTAIEVEMRPIDEKIKRLPSPMDSLGRLMDRYSKPMDSLGKIMEEKGKVLEKLAKEEETKVQKDFKRLVEFLVNENLIKNSKDFEIRLKGDKLLIDLNPQPSTVYTKVYNWLNEDKNWNRRLSLKEKDFEIAVKGENVYIKALHNGNRYYHHSSDFVAPPAARGFRSSGSEVPPPPPPPARVRTPTTPKPPKPVRVGVVDKNFQITDALIRDNKGTCSVYVVSEKDGKSTAKAITAMLVNDKWTAKGLKVGDKVILKSDVKVKNGDAVKLLAANN